MYQTLESILLNEKQTNMPCFPLTQINQKLGFVSNLSFFYLSLSLLPKHRAGLLHLTHLVFKRQTLLLLFDTSLLFTLCCFINVPIHRENQLERTIVTHTGLFKLYGVKYIPKELQNKQSRYLKTLNIPIIVFFSNYNYLLLG